MRLLLDTHIYLWWIKDDKKLPKSVDSKIINAEEVYISSATIWEIAIKIKLGKLAANIDQLIEDIHKNHFQELPITSQHASKISNLPGIHKDPFDRILIAQAISEPLTLLTADAILREYSELVELI